MDKLVELNMRKKLVEDGLDRAAARDDIIQINLLRQTLKRLEKEINNEKEKRSNHGSSNRKNQRRY